MYIDTIISNTEQFCKKDTYLKKFEFVLLPLGVAEAGRFNRLSITFGPISNFVLACQLP